jgi:hypothetical protein
VDADPLPAHLAPGSIVAGRYRVLRQLGSGGIGIVLEAEQLGLGQRVALKLLRNELLDDPDTLARFEREARVVSQLSSENIVRIFGVERSEHGEPIMVLEFLFGHPVDALIDDPNPISISAAVDIVAEACAGLAVAHAAGVVHRDVKPGNLFLAVRADRSQVVKVLDFGLTTELGSKDARLTSTRRSFGTPLYMSPEQIMSAKDVDPRTDQHALALSLFELLTKRPAFWDTLPSALTVKIVTTPPPSARGYRPEIPEGLDEAILRALAKQPQGRFATIADFRRRHSALRDEAGARRRAPRADGAVAGPADRHRGARGRLGAHHAGGVDHEAHGAGRGACLADAALARRRGGARRGRVRSGARDRGRPQSLRRARHRAAIGVGAGGNLAAEGELDRHARDFSGGAAAHRRAHASCAPDRLDGGE